MKIFRSLKAATLLTSFVVLVFLGISLFCSWYFLAMKDHEEEIEAFRKNYIEQEKRSLQKEVNRVINYIRYRQEDIRKDTRDQIRSRVEKEFDKEKIMQKKVLDRIESIHYGKDDYVYVLNFDGALLSHPIDALVKKDLSAIEDPERVKVIKDQLALCEKKGEGFLRYRWMKPSLGRRVEKLTFVKSYPRWGWIIGTGVYMDDLESKMDKANTRFRDTFKRRLILGSSLFIFFIVASFLLSAFLWRKVKFGLDSFRDFLIQSATEHTVIDENALAFSEFSQIASYANHMNFERMTAENRLKNSEQKYRNILESIEEGYYEVDLKGRITFCNRSLCDILGYEMAELMGMEYSDYMELDSAKTVYRTFNKVYRTGISEKGFDWKIVRKNGERRYLETSVTLLKDNHGNPTGFRGMVRDVTDKKQVEEELTGTKKFLEDILESAVDGITTTDLSGNIVYFSTKMLALLGYDRTELLGQKVYTIYENGIEDAKYIMSELNEKGELKDHEMRLVTRDNQLTDIIVSASFLKNHKEKITGTLGVFKDTTEKKNLEFQLRQAQKMEAIGTLAGGVAHDFNNILQAINGYTTIMFMDKDREDPDYKSLNAIKKSVERAAELVKKLLFFSRKMDTEKSSLDINREVKQALSILKRTIPKMIEIEVELEESPGIIHADPVQIEQVILNLGSNAADAMPEGGRIIITTKNVSLDREFARAHMGSAPGNYMMLTVSDTGSGIDPETREHIFEPFFTTKEVGRGTGLGLASVYGIVKNHGGYITCDSENGLGTAFIIYFPLLKKDSGRLDREISNNTPKGGTETLLVVDDEEAILDFCRVALGRFGYEVMTASSGEEALEIYKEKQETVDLLIMDLSMPGMGGQRSLREIKGLYPAVQVIVASGYSPDVQAGVLKETGAEGFVAKPYRLEDLLNAVRRVLDAKVV
ncbi:MAG: PAS domain S-box protein [Desulfarculaceae bacterium]|nr:PAS domain S-box protein [Desulfarculaceae bacterium]